MEETVDKLTSLFIVTFVAGVLVASLIWAIAVDRIYIDKPTAMDVYQGKTTLEVTYRGNIPVDSVVVFKDK